MQTEQLTEITNHLNVSYRQKYRTDLEYLLNKTESWHTDSKFKTLLEILEVKGKVDPIGSQLFLYVEGATSEDKIFVLDSIVKDLIPEEVDFIIKKEIEF